MAETRPVGTGKGTRPVGRSTRIQGAGPKSRAIMQPIIRPDHGEHGCHAKKDDGEYCKAYAVKGEEYCIGHKRSLSGDAS